MRVIIILTFLIIPLANTLCQSKEKNKLVKLSGSASCFTSIYHTSDSNTFYSPFSYGINVSPTLKIKSFTLPFHFTYANNKTNVTTPFIRLGIAPSYKWAKFYVGNNTVNFSRYAFSGLNVFGAGFELNPKFFHLGFITGRLTPRIFADSTLSNYNRLKPRYQTNGYALRTGLKFKAFKFLVTYFSGEDDESSLPYHKPNIKLYPRYSKAVGVELMLRLGSHFSIQSNGGLSIFTRNKNAANLDSLLRSSNAKPIPEWAKTIEKNPNSSSQLLFAYDNLFQFSSKSFSLSLRQKEIKPDFKSLGLAFITNDVKQYTIEPSFRLKENKFIANFSLGIQQNNLRNKLKLNNRSKIYSANISINPSKKVWINGNYSNFGTEVKSSNITFDDSISIKNINSNASLNVIYYFENNGSNSKSFGLTLNTQKAKETYEFNIFNNTNFNSTFANIYYNSSIAKALSYSLGFNFHRNTTQFLQMPDKLFDVESYGVFGNVSKPLLENGKLNVALNGFVNLSGTPTTSKSLAHGATLSAIYKLSEKWNLSFGYNYSKAIIESNNFFQQSLNSNITVNF